MMPEKAMGKEELHVARRFDFAEWLHDQAHPPDGGIFLDACKDHTRAEFVQLAAEKEAAGDVPEQFR